MKKTNIIILPEFGSFGGARTYFFHLMEYYTSIPKLNIILCLEQKQIDPEINSIISKNNLLIEIIPSRPNKLKKILRKFPFSLLFDWFVLYSINKKFKPDLFVFSIINPGLFLGSAILKSRKIYIVHTDILNPGKYFFKIRTFLKLFQNRKIQFVVVSEYLKNNMERYWLKGNNRSLCRIIYNMSTKNIITKHTIGEKISSNILVLSVGHLEWYKNPILWLELAIKYLDKNTDKNVTFCWVGNGSLYEQLNQKIPNRYKEQIIFTGYKKNVDLYYLDADIYLLTSRIETLGISVIDAMMYKLPCIVSSSGGLPELIIDHYNGFVISNENIEKYLECIELLVNNIMLRSEFGNNGQLRYFEKFNKESWVNNMDELNSSIFETPMGNAEN